MKWKIKEKLSDDLSEQLLLFRGLKTKEEQECFLNPDYKSDLHDPFLMKDMEKAVKRILKAVKKNEKVILFGDYDADGICGTVVMHDFFRKIGFENFEVYIPDRYKEGYGLNNKAIDEFIENKIDLIITIDCGITDVSEVKKAKDHDIDVIILDHHEQTGELPDAVAVVDPKRKGDKYPFKDMCGAAVAFKTVKAILSKKDFNVVLGWHRWLLDVVAIATVTDMMPLIDENRTILFWGINVLKKTPRLGLNVLFEATGINKKFVTEDDIGFVIGPRINATSRMDHATIGFELLITNKLEEARWLMQRVDERNKERKQIAEKIQKEVVLRHKKNSPIVFEGDRNWSPGLIGLVANRLLETFQKPVVIWGKGEGPEIKGSARAHGSSGINFVSVFEKIDNGLLIEYGGHALAAGFAAKEKNIDAIKKKILSGLEKIKTKQPEDILWIDKELDLKQVDWNMFSTLEKFAPFGKGNEKPIFLLKNVLVENVRSFGNGGIHLQFDFLKENREKISAVGFFMNGGGDSVDVKNGDKIDLVFSLEKNTYMGAEDLRMRIIDFKLVS